MDGSTDSTQKADLKVIAFIRFTKMHNF